MDEDIRPPQLSFEMAPKRSGFHWRVEALNASLWSALISGRKRWGLYPPSYYFVPGTLDTFKLDTEASIVILGLTLSRGGGGGGGGGRVDSWCLSKKL